MADRLGIALKDAVWDWALLGTLVGKYPQVYEDMLFEQC